MVGSEKLPGLNPLSKGVLPRWKPLHRIITPLAVMLAFVFAVPIEAVDRCDYGKTNYYIETRCIKYHNPYCASARHAKSSIATPGPASVCLMTVLAHNMLVSSTAVYNARTAPKEKGRRKLKC